MWLTVVSVEAGITSCLLVVVAVGVVVLLVIRVA